MAEYLPDSDSLTDEATTITRDFRARLLCEQDVCFFWSQMDLSLKKRFICVGIVSILLSDT